MPSQPPPESPPKGGESDEPEAKVTRGNFEALAKGLFTVTREELADAEDAYRAALGAKAKRGARKNSKG